MRLILLACVGLVVWVAFGAPVPFLRVGPPPPVNTPTFQDTARRLERGESTPRRQLTADDVSRLMSMFSNSCQEKVRNAMRTRRLGAATDRVSAACSCVAHRRVEFMRQGIELRDPDVAVILMRRFDLDGREPSNPEYLGSLAAVERSCPRR